MSVSRALMVILLVVSSFSITLVSAETKPILRVGLSDNFAPFYYRDENGDFKGASYEIVTHVAKSLGYDIAVTQLSSLGMVLAGLDSGQVDLCVNLTDTLERREVAVFTSIPHIYESAHLIVRKDSPISFNGDLNTLLDYRFGPIVDWTFGAEFDGNDSLKKVYVNNSTEQIQGLLAGRFDIALNNPQFYEHHSKSLNLNHPFRVLEPALFNLPVSVGVSKRYGGADTLIQELDDAIASFIHQPEYRAILEKYGFIDQAKRVTVEP